MKLKDRVALITGAGTGMGRAIAEGFARNGARVVVNYSRSKQEADDVVARIQSEGGSAIAVAADVSSEPQVLAMMKRVEDEWGHLDVLVNNAGWTTRVPHQQLDALTDEIWDRTFNTNVRGMFYCVRAAVPLLKRQPGACVINIASVGGFGGSGSSMAYAASKSAMLTMTKSLARALAPDIRVNAIAPGFVRTRFGSWPAEAFNQAEQITPLGKLATVEDVASVALFLAADATAITGEAIVLDGGLLHLGGRTR